MKTNTFRSKSFFCQVNIIYTCTRTLGHIVLCWLAYASVRTIVFSDVSIANLRVPLISVCLANALSIQSENTDAALFHLSRECSACLFVNVCFSWSPVYVTTILNTFDFLLSTSTFCRVRLKLRHHWTPLLETNAPKDTSALLELVSKQSSPLVMPSYAIPSLIVLLLFS